MTDKHSGSAACLAASALLVVVAMPTFAQDGVVAESGTPRLVMVVNAVDSPSSTNARFQIEKPEGPPPTPRHTGIRATLKAIPGDVRHVPSKWNVVWAGVGAGMALAIHPADGDINARLVGRPWVHRVFVTGKYLGTYSLVPAAGVIYAYGRTTDRPKVSHMGMDLIRALVLNQILTQAIKYSVRRERPDHSDHFSFPSGHASSTFAFATALERHLSWHYAVPAYVFSAYVASSRLHENRHFASDVAFGAAVGIIAGRTVTRHGRDMFSLNVVPTDGGLAVMMTK